MGRVFNLVTVEFGYPYVSHHGRRTHRSSATKKPLTGGGSGRLCTCGFRTYNLFGGTQPSECEPRQHAHASVADFEGALKYACYHDPVNERVAIVLADLASFIRDVNEAARDPAKTEPFA